MSLVMPSSRQADFRHGHGLAVHGASGGRVFAGAHVCWQVLHMDKPAGAEDGGVLDDVLQLADVAGKGVRQEQPHGLL